MFLHILFQYLSINVFICKKSYQYSQLSFSTLLWFPRHKKSMFIMILLHVISHINFVVHVNIQIQETQQGTSPTFILIVLIISQRFCKHTNLLLLQLLTNASWGKKRFWILFSFFLLGLKRSTGNIITTLPSPYS